MPSKKAQLLLSGTVCNVLHHRQWCDFVVMTKNLHVERITADDEFERKIIPKLKDFYFTAVLPELASPQANIREPCHWVTNEWKKL